MGIFSMKPKEISRVKFMGVRTAQETKILATYNGSMYCFLIEYTDGTRSIAEYGAKDKALQEILQFINID